MNLNRWKRKDLFGIEVLERDELEFIFEIASDFRAKMDAKDKSLPSLEGQSVVNLFMEPSTRTRVAFEMAATRLQADVITISQGASSLVKGETLRDTAMNIQALGADIIVIRHSSAGSAKYLSKIVDIPVINAGDGAHEHPTQALLDCFTLKKHLGDLNGKKVTILGDIVYSTLVDIFIWKVWIKVFKYSHSSSISIFSSSKKSPYFES